MKYSNMKNVAEKIVMPEDMKRRIITNCKLEISQTRKDSIMKKNKMFKRPAAVFATMAICLSLSVTALAATGVLKGFFQDVKRPDGAVVGTTYEQATDEITIELTVNDDVLTIETSFTGKDPFIAEELGLGDYMIVDGNGKIVKEGTSTGYAEIIDGHATMKIYMNDVEDGSYKLKINSFIATKKADQPLTVYGNWEHNFTK